MTEWRALTLKQPWAWAICHAGKRVENRSWPVPATVALPARVMVHAAARPDRRTTRWHDPDRDDHPLRMLPVHVDVDQVHHAWYDENVYGSGYARLKWHTLGAVVAVATITGCHSQHEDEGVPCSPWAETHGLPVPLFHWLLDDVTVLDEPIPAKGKLGLWRPDADLTAAVERQLGPASEDQ